jgi:hypothetical protein
LSPPSLAQRTTFALCRLPVSDRQTLAPDAALIERLADEAIARLAPAAAVC